MGEDKNCPQNRNFHKDSHQLDQSKKLALIFGAGIYSRGDVAIGVLCPATHHDCIVVGNSLWWDHCGRSNVRRWGPVKIGE